MAKQEFCFASGVLPLWQAHVRTGWCSLWPFGNGFLDFNLLVATLQIFRIGPTQSEKLFAEGQQRPSSSVKGMFQV